MLSNQIKIAVIAIIIKIVTVADVIAQPRRLFCVDSILVKDKI